ncbi:Calcium-binding component of the spindle pole body (SPB) half-bridge [Vermiconidia calcicola]|uniref:Calcium-binding component of the spindle pole body (SPB) half-bridge n=1 Tax=Vermiconidia calcicola TaxID=1690605 RepID=A0ACC3N480_9PEZI|nr:Calcium-binding component of the spindle pole body (SPB) half-bridge [Vermiconidia calcicola]
MATSTSHPPFPSRPYTSGLGRTGGQSAFQSTPYNTQTPFNAPVQNTAGFGGAASGPSTTQQQREAQRLERERQERAERERREAEERGVLDRLSEEQREEVNEAFSLFDLDKDNYIDYHELKVALKALGFDLPKTEILNILQTYGIPASQLSGGPSNKQPLPAQPTFSGPSRLLLSHAHFLTIAAQRIDGRDPREEILRAFELFDMEGKGRIELGDLRRVARELGEGLQEEELQAMIEEFDVRGEGGIGREEFVGICLG